MQKREIETMKILLVNRKIEGNADAQNPNTKKPKELF